MRSRCWESRRFSASRCRYSRRGRIVDTVHGSRQPLVMRSLGFFLAAILLWIMVPAASVSAPDRKSACRSTQAQPATIEAIRSDYQAWRGKCVALGGIAVGVRLYADRQATLERKGNFGEEVRRSIVLYPRRRIRSGREPRLVEVVGRIGSCKVQNDIVGAMQEAHPEQIIMVSGYCHTSLETYIEPVVVRVLRSGPITRLLEEEVPEDRRELVDAPAEFIGLALYLSGARTMADALATGDEETFRRLVRPDLQDDIDKLGSKSPPGWLRSALREVHSEFTSHKALRRSFAAIYPLGTRPQRVLVDRADRDAFRTTGDVLSHFVVCWCKTADCTGRWPVRAFDADNHPNRPYLCAIANDYILGPRAGRALQVNVDAEEEGFAEPS